MQFSPWWRISWEESSTAVNVQNQKHFTLTTVCSPRYQVLYHCPWKKKEKSIVFSAWLDGEKKETAKYFHDLRRSSASAAPCTCSSTCLFHLGFSSSMHFTLSFTLHNKQQFALVNLHICSIRPQRISMLLWKSSQQISLDEIKSPTTWKNQDQDRWQIEHNLRICVNVNVSVVCRCVDSVCSFLTSNWISKQKHSPLTWQDTHYTE